MKIVVVADDSPVIRKVARRLIEDFGFVVVEAADGQTALHLCNSNMPDAIIVDWDLPDMPGLEVARGVTAMPKSEMCKIIYMTSEVMIPEMAKAKRVGAAGFLMKPFNRQLIAEKFAELGLMDDTQQAA